MQCHLVGSRPRRLQCPQMGATLQGTPVRKGVVAVEGIAHVFGSCTWTAAAVCSLGSHPVSWDTRYAQLVGGCEAKAIPWECLWGHSAQFVLTCGGQLQGAALVVGCHAQSMCPAGAMLPAGCALQNCPGQVLAGSQQSVCPCPLQGADPAHTARAPLPLARECAPRLPQARRDGGRAGGGASHGR